MVEQSRVNQQAYRAQIRGIIESLPPEEIPPEFLAKPVDPIIPEIEEPIVVRVPIIP